MRILGRALQICGLVVLPVSMVMQMLNPKMTLGLMLTVMVAGAAAFYLGRIIEGYAPR